MNNYIFLTTEGYTYQPNSESVEPDCDNAQLIGIAEGTNQLEAFKNLLNKYTYLKESNFEEIYCYQLKDDYRKTMKFFTIEKNDQESEENK